MRTENKCRLTWIDQREITQAFHQRPFPERGHRGDLGELRRSISRHGIIQPIIARVKEGRLQVICGYRRWLAAQVAQISAIPVLVFQLSDSEAEMIFKEEENYRLADFRSKDPRLESDSPEPLAPETSSSRDAIHPSPLALDLENFNANEYAVGTATAPAGAVSAPADEPPEQISSAWSSRSQAANAALDPSLSVRQQVLALQKTLTGLYGDIRRERMVRLGEFEAIVDRLRELAPISSGLDIRSLEGESGRGFLGDPTAQLASQMLRTTLLLLYFSKASKWSEKIAHRLGLIGLLYDVGMLFVPEDWCSCPYPWTRSRKDLIKNHTLIGERILLQSGPAAKELSEVARDHHERWDGSGYPHRKTGRSVSLNARLTALIDCFSALISTRPHRRAYLYREAMNVIEEAGRLGIHEPALVRQFSNVMTAVPIGVWAKLPDGSLAQVIGVESGQWKSHQLLIQISGSKNQQGQEIWMPLGDLQGAISEQRP